MSETDLQLLMRYARQKGEDAFAELVRRHLNLVFSAALRQVRSPQLAEEVAQSVFTDLARQAERLAPDTILTAWLYQVTHRTAIDVVRREASRQLREQVSVELTAMNATATDWTEVEPLLDEAMHALDDTARTAVLLRYFENKSFREVGQMLDTTEDAARKRLNRAVERLREFFAKRGVTIGASGLVVAISTNAVQAAPAGLAATLSTVALSGTTLTTAAIATATKAIAMTTLQKTVVTATLAAAVGAGIYEAHQTSQLRGQVRTLQQQQAPLLEQIQQLHRERDQATNRLSSLLAENEQLKSAQNSTDLLKLRSEVGQLRQELQGSAAARVALLKQKLQEMPDKTIPELKFLTEKDWNNAAWNADLNTDDGVRLALSKLRDEAVDTFLNLTRKALKKYLAANNDILPADLLPLKPYFDTPVTDDMLQRYKFMQTGKLSSNLSDPVVSKAVYADKDYDSNQQMSMTGGGGGSFNRFHDAIYDAAMAFTIDNGGQTPSDPSQIASYLKRPIDAATMQKYFGEITTDIAANPPDHETITLAPVLKAYAEANNGRHPNKPSDLLPYLTTPEQQAALRKMEKDNPAPK